MCDVTGEWEVWGVEHFVDAVMNSIQFVGQLPGMKDMTAIYDLSRAAAYRSGANVAFVVGNVQNIIMNCVVNSANEHTVEAKRGVIRNAVETIFRKYGLIAEVS